MLYAAAQLLTRDSSRQNYESGMAFVDENEIYDSNSSFPVATYEEPHLAVRYGVAAFECVKILTIS